MHQILLIYFQNIKKINLKKKEINHNLIEKIKIINN